MAKLTPKQAKFCLEYLVDLNATQAAIRAGYSKRSAKQQGAENLTKPDIREEISRKGNEISANTEVTVANILSRLNMLADSAIRDGDRANANRSLDLLGKHHGMFTDRHEVSGPGGGAIDQKWTVTIVDAKE